MFGFVCFGFECLKNIITGVPKRRREHSVEEPVREGEGERDRGGERGRERENNKCFESEDNGIF